MDPRQNTGPGIKYAFCLGIMGHMDDLRNRVGQKVLLLNQIELFLDQHVLLKYHQEDEETNKQRTFVESMATLMLPPSTSDLVWKKKLTSAELVRIINAEQSLQKPQASERRQELSPKLAAMLVQCVLTLQGDITSVIAQYFLGLSTEMDGAPEWTSAMFKETAEAISGSQSPSISSVFELFSLTLMGLLAALSAPQSDDHIKVLREQGNSLMANQAYPQAIQVYTTALHYGTVSGQKHVLQILTNRAIAYIGLNCFPEAVADLNTAVVADRTFTPAWIQLGYCHLYMGSGLTALKMYHMALRTISGDVVPELLLQEHGDIIESYKRLRSKSTLPLLVRKIVLSLLLTERRATQQNEPTSEISTIITHVKEMLAKLAEYAPAEDRSAYSYPTSYERISLLPVERANRSHPDILTHDIAQDILANTGFDSGNLPSGPPNIPPPPPAATTAAAETGFNARAAPEVNVNVTGSGPGDAATAARAAASPNSIRSLLNNIGRMAENNENGQEMSPYTMMTEVSRAFLDSFSGGVGTVLSQQLNNARPPEQNLNENVQREQGNENREPDTDMPEDPDLD